MYFGHIGSNNVVLKNMIRKGTGFSVFVLFRRSNTIKQMPASMVLSMLKSIPDYQITSGFVKDIKALVPESYELRRIVEYDLVMCICSIYDE